jgi:hypothetical protein
MLEARSARPTPARHRSARGSAAGSPGDPLRVARRPRGAHVHRQPLHRG